MFQVCSRKQPPLCELEKSVSTKAMTYYVGQKLTRGLFGAGDTFISLQNAIAMKASLEAAVNRSGDHLYYVGLGGHKGSGMFSYPNYNGRFKSLDHPDIYQLGLLAEQAGMDYRVLVLQRNGLDILKSVDRRNFGTKVDEEPKILIDNAAALHAQLFLLDPRFYYCLQYEHLYDLTENSSTNSSSSHDTTAAERERNNVIRFLHPTTLSGGIFEEINSSVEPRTLLAITNKTPGWRNKMISENERSSNTEYLASQLNARIAMIGDLCRKQKSLFLNN
eukprot:gene28574-37538_t